jgi:Na+-transporting NADH:ubiquinone oxidoreductase subunit NqrA
MIVTPEQLSQTSILTQEGVYDCCLIQQRFSYKLFGNSVSSLGDVITFRAPINIGPLFFENSIVIAAELPNASMFAGTCFARLYAAQLGSILSSMINEEYTVDESCIFSGEAQASLSMINQVKDSVLLHIVFPLKEGNTKETFSCLKLDEEKLLGFEISAVEAFRQLTRSIFIETRRDNF